MRLSERLRDRSDHYLPDWAREVMDDAAARIDEAAAFLDQMAERWDKFGVGIDAANCRAMAARLRGSAEPVAVQPHDPSSEEDQDQHDDR